MSLLDNAPAIEAAAIQMFVDEMAHVRDDPRSRSAARRRWDATTDQVRDSWRSAARRVISSAEEAQTEQLAQDADADGVRLQSLGSKPKLVVYGADEAETREWAKALDDLMGGAS